MNIVSPFDFSGAADLEDLKARLSSFQLNLINQLRKEPTVFFADPATEVEAVAGAKSGDVAVWKDGAGVDHFSVF